jgi:transaldolase
MAEARRLWHAVGRENAMIKVPGTPEATLAIRQLLTEGINVNITLLFSRVAYGRFAEAYLSALEARADHGEDVSRVASVASFFVSRIDSMVDRMLDELSAAAETEALRRRVEAVRGRVAIANARLAYQDYKAIVAGPRWARLRQLGARPQRLLWGSTSTKDPRYRDVMYPEALIGPDTVDTMPPETFAAFRDHGRVGPTLDAEIEAARATLAELPSLGISLEQVTDRLLADGVRLFAEPFAGLLAAIDARRRAGVGAGASA